MTDGAPILSVDLRALAANYDVLQNTANASVAAVVKADAYGLGLEAVAQTLAASGCKIFFVALASEGVLLRAILPDAEIFVLSPSVAADAASMIEHAVKPCLYDLEGIRLFADKARESGREARVALHVETGIHRLGLELKDVAAFLERKSSMGVEVDLLMSHLACADDPDSEMNRQQLTRFRDFVAMFPGVRASLANSAGIFLGDDYHFDLVRPGISLYGHDPHYRSVTSRVEPVAAFHAQLGQVKTVSEGGYIGYGATVRCDTSTRIGVMLAGYADGIPRHLRSAADDKAHPVFVAGRRVPILGRNSMDLTVIDLSALSDEDCDQRLDVELFGSNISIEEFAERAGTIPYEVLTGIGGRVTRRYSRQKEPAST